MKKTFLFMIAFFASAYLSAQTAGDYIELVRSQLKADKKTVVAEAMQLTPDESTVFWPLYNEYNDKMYAIQDKRVALIKDFATHFDNMTPEKADELARQMFSIKGELLKLDRMYYSKFKKILPVVKVARYFQLENKIETLVNAKLALEIPLLEHE
jgi:hypothetical protein